MSNKNGKWIQRIPKDEKVKDADFYVTPYPMTFALLEYLKGQGVPKTASILEPCTGEGHLAAVLKTYFTNVTELDKYSLPVSTDFLEYQPEKKFDLCVFNPPYNNKFKFIDHSFEVADIVIVLLPGLAEQYIKICEQYKDTDKYAGKITCYPKAFMSQTVKEDGTIEQGGTTNYGFLIFNTKYPQGKQKFEIMEDVRKYYEKVKDFLDKK